MSSSKIIIPLLWFRSQFLTLTKVCYAIFFQVTSTSSERHGIKYLKRCSQEVHGVGSDVAGGFWRWRTSTLFWSRACVMRDSRIVMGPWLAYWLDQKKICRWHVLALMFSTTKVSRKCSKIDSATTILPHPTGRCVIKGLVDSLPSQFVKTVEFLIHVPSWPRNSKDFHLANETSNFCAKSGVNCADQK